MLFIFQLVRQQLVGRLHLVQGSQERLLLLSLGYYLSYFEQAVVQMRHVHRLVPTLDLLEPALVQLTPVVTHIVFLPIAFQHYCFVGVLVTSFHASDEDGHVLSVGARVLNSVMAVDLLVRLVIVLATNEVFHYINV